MGALSFQEAWNTVLRESCAQAPQRPPFERVELARAAGRVLAEPILADRDLPPAAVSMRDGFAFAAADAPGWLPVDGEIRAGQAPNVVLFPGHCVEIMTGALLPNGADAVEMVEQVVVEAGAAFVKGEVPAGQNVNARGAVAQAGDVLLVAGSGVDYAAVALAASVGLSELEVFPRPRVAILSTGDEVVGVEERPLAHQVRNSNAAGLAAQVERAGGVAVMLGVAPDEPERTRELIEAGLECDLLLISGGVSAGKYDFVEQALAEAGETKFFFDRVRIQPGAPCVFGATKRREGEPAKLFFGLPGNPVSAMVCFELFAKPAIQALAGHWHFALPFGWAKLTEALAVKPGLTRFLPATLHTGGTLTALPWAGSADLAAVARANCWLVTDAEKGRYEAGEWIQFMAR